MGLHLHRQVQNQSQHARPAAGTIDRVAADDLRMIDICSDGDVAMSSEKSEPAELPPEEIKKRAMLAKQVAAGLGEIVSLLVRSPTEKHHSLADLEWMVLPAVTTGQFAVADAQSKQTGVVMPVAAVLWAFVSEDIDRQLSANLNEPFRLKPPDWRSGKIPWIVMAIGDPKVVGTLLQNVSRSVFKDQPAKMRAKGPKGDIVVGRLEAAPARS
jgi:hemolysin-activating ACP:hemolysin acyltransferase